MGRRAGRLRKTLQAAQFGLRVVEHLFDPKHAWTLVVVSQAEDVIAACDRLVDIDLREAPNEPPPGIAALLAKKKQNKEGS